MRGGPVSGLPGSKLMVGWNHLGKCWCREILDYSAGVPIKTEVACDFDNVAFVLKGVGTSSAVYALVGLAGLYQPLTWKAIQRRWYPDAASARAQHA